MIPDESSWGAVLRHISTSSAVNPTMVVAIAAMLIGFLGLQFGPESAFLVFSGLIIAPLVVFLGQVVFFTIFDRDRLQNDKHVEQKMMITRRLVGTMESGHPTELLLPADDEQVVNPIISDGGTGRV